MMRRHVHGVMLCVLLLAVVLLASAHPVVRAAPGPTIQGDAQAVAELTAIYRRFGEAKSWRSRMTIPGSTPATHTIAFVAPDRFHMVMSAGNTTSEFFVIGKSVWTKSGGTCTKLPGSVQLPNPREAMQQQNDAVVQVVRGGTEAVDGTPTQTYNVTVTSQGTTVRQKLYVATATGLPRRVEMATAQGTMVIDYFDYGAAITINDPPC